MADETKMPRELMEEAGRDYNELGIFRYKEKNPTLEAAQVLWEFLPWWMAARKMAVADETYNRSISRVIARNAEIILKAAQEMAGTYEEGGEKDGRRHEKALRAYGRGWQGLHDCIL